MENKTERTTYQGLKYKTRGNANPQGRPRVYFCCHKDDFDRFFESVTEEIFTINPNVAIWYHDACEEIRDYDTFLEDLSQIQLFVIPVTGKFLYEENVARTLEFDYAIKNHIPVLPLLQENGLEEDFNYI